MLLNSTCRVTIPSKFTLPVRDAALAHAKNQLMAHEANLESPDPQYAAE